MKPKDKPIERVTPKDLIRLVVRAIFIVLFIWGASWFSIANLFDEVESRGQFGDMFGAVNALFSGLAFAAIVITLHLQRIDLQVQREDFDTSQRTLQAATEAHKAQVQLSATSSLLANLPAMIERAESHAVSTISRAGIFYLDGVQDSFGAQSCSQIELSVLKDIQRNLQDAEAAISKINNEISESAKIDQAMQKKASLVYAEKSVNTYLSYRKMQDDLFSEMQNMQYWEPSEESI
jgi:hypothetical protein